MRIFAISCAVISLVVVPTLPVAAAEGNTSVAEYLGGTIKAIPANTVGTLDLTDPSDLVFRYGKSTYRLPFPDIKNFELTGSGATAGARRPHLGQVPLPSLAWAKTRQERTLNLSYRTLGSSPGVLSFRLIGKDFTRAEWILRTRTESAREEAIDGNRAKLPEAWWGDRWWKTSRNSAQWGGTEPEAQSGTK